MKERIKQIRLKLGINQGEFAKKTGIIQQQLSKYERGENRPSSEFLIVLSEKFNVNINWLLTGKGEIFNDSETTQSNGRILEIPFSENETDKQEIKSIFIDANTIDNIENTDTKNLRIVKMHGDNLQSVSGIHGANDGDFLLVDIAQNDFPSFGIYAYSTSQTNKICAAAFQPLPDGSLRLNNFNERYPSISYTKKQLLDMKFKIEGKVIKNISCKF